MRRVLLFCVGILLALTAGPILWKAPDLFTAEDGWHPAALTRMVGLGIIVEGGLAALGAGLCLGRAVAPRTSARTGSGTAVPDPAPAAVAGGPVLPLCGILFLLAAVGPYGQAWHHADTLAVMDSTPGQYGRDVVEEIRSQERAGWTFGFLWVVVGGALVATPLYLKPRTWQVGWRISGVGCAIAGAGFVLSGMGVLVWFANGLAMEGASKDLAFAGDIGVLGGALIAVAGSVIAVAARSKA